LPFSAFVKNKTRKDGINYCCSECSTEKQRIYREAQKKKREEASGKVLEQPRRPVAGDEAAHDAVSEAVVCQVGPSVEAAGAEGAVAPELRRVSEEPQRDLQLQPDDWYPRSRRECILEIDFDRHMDMLRRLREIAEQELRTPECQVIYWLRAILEGAEVRIDG
jgi:hypothetical protein